MEIREQQLKDAKILAGVLPATVEERMGAAQRAGNLPKVLGLLMEADGVNRPASSGLAAVQEAGPADAGERRSARAERVEQFRGWTAEQREKAIDDLIAADYPADSDLFDGEAA
jgi:hypothetical protein